MCTCDRLGAARVICSKYPNLALLVPWQNRTKTLVIDCNSHGSIPSCFFLHFGAPISSNYKKNPGLSYKKAWGTSPQASQ